MLHRKIDSGFTLIELLVVISIIGILAAGSVAILSGNQAQARDAQRQTELRELELAIESYRRENRQYPSGCSSGWSGHAGTNNVCTCGGDELQSDAYICGLMPRYINEIPIDTRAPESSIGGYMYITNDSRSAFKLVAPAESGATTMTPCPDYCNCDNDSVMAIWGGLVEGDDGSESDFSCVLPGGVSAPSGDDDDNEEDPETEETTSPLCNIIPLFCP